ncbi:hypothetical protein PPNSA23_11640 [Phyllobacterium phragmitis]|uniref:Uncharacterized protein n=1 Tax=Phyllobacterium phragmitis TaxID=2670329 RepID=A0ABQ0GX38_9HYPH
MAIKWESISKLLFFEILNKSHNISEMNTISSSFLKRITHTAPNEHFTLRVKYNIVKESTPNRNIIEIYPNSRNLVALIKRAYIFDERTKHKLV